ncbi:phosphate transporter [Gammaproteobacteria bacterium]|nr:phosphate transporter [Gammaproteobacteria bacterium]
MFDFFIGLDTTVLITLILSLGLVLAFEFVNGFHDTANAVATVIYTKAMKPNRAVLLSGIFNFFGVVFGGLAVAYSIINLLPMDLLANVNSGKGLLMVFSLLTAALIWNLGTWYIGIPASSSHTLIGSILGVGVANALVNGASLVDGINWAKANDVFLSLLLSPIVGGGLAGLLLWLLLKWKPTSYIHKTPHQRHDVEKRKRPPFWPRFILICSAMGMSFGHGSNDGQKGVGLMMLVLFSIVPASFVVNMHSNSLEIEHTRVAARHLAEFHHTYHDQIDTIYSLSKPNPNPGFDCQPADVSTKVDHILRVLGDIKTYDMLKPNQRLEVRNDLICLGDITKRYQKIDSIPLTDRNTLKSLYKSLTLTTQYAPFWVIALVALALGLGTMIGWRRVVETVGGKIGKKEMTYAQGMSAQIMAATSIGLASFLGFPVSTTHILSSAVAGTMVANKAGLQMGTVKAILMAWILTLPVSMGLSFSLYLIGTKLFI